MISFHAIVGLPGAGKTTLLKAVSSRLGGAECTEPFKFCGKIAGRQFTAQKLIMLDQVPHWKALALFESSQKSQDWNDAIFMAEGIFWTSLTFLKSVQMSGAILRTWEVSAPDIVRAARLRMRTDVDRSTLRLQSKIQEISKALPVSQLFNDETTDINLLAIRVLEMALQRHLPIFMPNSKVPDETGKTGIHL